MAISYLGAGKGVVTGKGVSTRVSTKKRRVLEEEKKETFVEAAVRAQRAKEAKAAELKARGGKPVSAKERSEVALSQAMRYGVGVTQAKTPLTIVDKGFKTKVSPEQVRMAQTQAIVGKELKDIRSYGVTTAIPKRVKVDVVEATRRTQDGLRDDRLPYGIGSYDSDVYRRADLLDREDKSFGAEFITAVEKPKWWDITAKAARFRQQMAYVGMTTDRPLYQIGSGLLAFGGGFVQAATMPFFHPKETVVGTFQFGKGLVTKPFETGALIGEELKTDPSGFIGQQFGAYYGVKAPIKGVSVVSKKVSFIGKTYVPAEKIFEPEILRGEKIFPEVPKAQYRPEMGGKLVPEFRARGGGFHATIAQLKGPVKAGKSETPGLYIAPSVSKYFLRLERETPSYQFSLIPRKQPRPTIHFIETKVSRIPASVRARGFWAMQEYMGFIPDEIPKSFKGLKKVTGRLVKPKEKGVARISPQFEAGFKAEKEAIIPYTSELKPQQRTLWGKITGFEEYTIVEGQKIPIRKLKTVGVSEGVGGIGKQTKRVISESLETERYRKGVRYVTPLQSYELLRYSGVSRPYYTTSSYVASGLSTVESSVGVSGKTGVDKSMTPSSPKELAPSEPTPPVPTRPSRGRGVISAGSSVTGKPFVSRPPRVPISYSVIDIPDAPKRDLLPKKLEKEGAKKKRVIKIPKVKRRFVYTPTVEAKALGIKARKRQRRRPIALGVGFRGL